MFLTIFKYVTEVSNFQLLYCIKLDLKDWFISKEVLKPIWQTWWGSLTLPVSPTAFPLTATTGAAVTAASLCTATATNSAWQLLPESCSLTHDPPVHCTASLCTLTLISYCVCGITDIEICKVQLKKKKNIYKWNKDL